MLRLSASLGRVQRNIDPRILTHASAANAPPRRAVPHVYMLSSVPLSTQAPSHASTATRAEALLPPLRTQPLPRPVSVAILSHVIPLDNAHTPELSDAARNVEAQVYEILREHNLAPSALRKLGANILQVSRDADRYNVASSLFWMAFRRGDDDAGYSWATMVLEGLTRSQQDKHAASSLSTKAVEIYTDLAKKGNAHAEFGLGRIVLSHLRKNASPAAADKQRVVSLWQRAAKHGLADAWYELGRLYHSGFLPGEQDKALGALENGARAGSAHATYALGVLHGIRAEKTAQQDPKRAHDASTLSSRYFLQAAQKGHAPSAYNMGVRYLLREDSEKHQTRWGVTPDDRSAREWFGAAASKLHLPAMMNYSAMLLDGRGAAGPAPTRGDLLEARRIYTRVLQLAEAQLEKKGGMLPQEDTDTPVVLRQMTEQAAHGLAKAEQLLADAPHDA
ncbi:hypothetical protein MVES1_003351 [Malassezia vespertilionis]|uniref:HCP-like protein n=1 Tax=Malassezia vespertilionis TaxID=2020962 RepID=A0A2N1J7D8_9BASI|nr:uncharacterized protein MVES1_003351 [Malassezia vespertilionis]PKI82382.1 hypothetical protein MVES_003594 [Malassezia vespertilionis]WFD07982.1 hypothetical protein MVES1_003351 [Malassezia vespertilionis]